MEGGKVDDQQVGLHPLPQQPPVGNPQLGGRHPGHFVDRLGEGKEVLLLDVLFQHPHAAAVIPGMALFAGGEAVGADDGEGAGDGPGNVLRAHKEDDHHGVVAALQQDVQRLFKGETYGSSWEMPEAGRMLH